VSPELFLNSVNKKIDRRFALFLDVDGTLLEFTDKPDNVSADNYLIAILKNLVIELNGAMALVSGRTINSLDNIFFPQKFTCSGQHGVERRTSDGLSHSLARSPSLNELKKQLNRFASNNSNLLVEDKGCSLVLHYRRVPSAKNIAHGIIKKILENDLEHECLAGNKIFEIKPKNTDKGKAISLFMNEPAFVGRTPIFIGDDITDEDGFRYINQIGGKSIQVGNPGERITKSLAHYKLSNVSAVRSFLLVLLKFLSR